MKIYTKKNKNIIEGRWWKINNNIKTSIGRTHDFEYDFTRLRQIRPQNTIQSVI